MNVPRSKTACFQRFERIGRRRNGRTCLERGSFCHEPATRGRLGETTLPGMGESRMPKGSFGGRLETAYAGAREPKFPGKAGCARRAHLRPLLQGLGTKTGAIPPSILAIQHDNLTAGTLNVDLGHAVAFASESDQGGGCFDAGVWRGRWSRGSFAWSRLRLAV